jgi:redox-sensitive bicupin YhaK (pirin superfamily)
VIHQDARLYVSALGPGQAVSYSLAPGRNAWLQVARGSVDLDGTMLCAGDGAAASEVDGLNLTGAETAEVLLFELS